MTATVPGATHPLNQIGATRIVDSVGKPELQIAEQFHAKLEVYPVTRYILTVTDTRDVPALWEAGWSGLSAEQARKTLGILAHDQLGGEWKRDWDGNYSDGPGAWIGPDGVQAQEARAEDKHLLRYATHGSGYTLTEKTA